MTDANREKLSWDINVIEETTRALTQNLQETTEQGSSVFDLLKKVQLDDESWELNALAPITPRRKKKAFRISTANSTHVILSSDDVKRSFVCISDVLVGCERAADIFFEFAEKST